MCVCGVGSDGGTADGVADAEDATGEHVSGGDEARVDAPNGDTSDEYITDKGVSDEDAIDGVVSHVDEIDEDASERDEIREDVSDGDAPDAERGCKDCRKASTLRMSLDCGRPCT